MKPARNPSAAINRRDLLKLAGGALGLGALGYAAGALGQPVAQPAARPGLPAYRDGDPLFPVLRGPYLQQAALAALLFPAEPDKLAAVCQRYLNLSPDAPYVYKPLFSSLVLVYADMLVSSLDQRDSQVGLIPETELGLWLPLLAQRRTAVGLVPDHPAWFLPALFVDDGSAIATGREVYGFNKQQAQFQKPADIRDPDFVASVTGLREFGPTARAEAQPLFELRRRVPAAALPKAAWSSWQAVGRATRESLPLALGEDPGAPLVEMAAQLVTGSAPLVFLKQFRDAADTRLACYQSQVEASFTLQTFHTGGFLDAAAYELVVSPLASHPIAGWLGLADGSPTLALWMQVDFSLGHGREVWRGV